ncbi:hypothetical protein EV586_103323 [Tumebacillus sp. BK434]|uniref:hypothetical protein n=1 Tax=Tumebacillus sp. BK434 TaxID=2512169 RepID=UPI0010514794|nr:hypothetical protein [Tumebacillus sp. BK434]TCP55669.1 hypothetical protein EV586_103323 [Tumebacillus sp. BK434]
MFTRTRAKQTIVQEMLVLAVANSGVVQIGDVWQGIDPFSYGEAYAGYRGAPGFLEQGRFEEPIDTRLHFADQVDEEVRDSNMWGGIQETFRPNTRGVSPR